MVKKEYYETLRSARSRAMSLLPIFFILNVTFFIFILYFRSSRANHHCGLDVVKKPRAEAK
jgi:hypothetical protein